MTTFIQHIAQPTNDILAVLSGFVHFLRVISVLTSSTNGRQEYGETNLRGEAGAPPGDVSNL